MSPTSSGTTHTFWRDLCRQWIGGCAKPVVAPLSVYRSTMTRESWRSGGHGWAFLLVAGTFLPLPQRLLVTALYPIRTGSRACRWIPHFSVYLIPFGGTHTFRRKPHFLALPPESTIRDPTEAPKTCSDTRFHARSAPCQKHNKPLEFLVLPSKTRNPRDPVRTHTFGIKMSVLVERVTGIEPA